MGLMIETRKSKVEISPILYWVGDFFASNFHFSRHTAQKQHPNTKA